VIIGFLDLTKLDNMKFRHGSDKEYLYEVAIDLSFVNCVFTDDVLAFVWDKTSETSYCTDFLKNVIFENCIFKKRSSFKYSTFKENACFLSGRFSQEANFKYASFYQAAIFSDCIFYDSSNFKYSVFFDFADFQDCLFKEDADYKYTKFYKGVSFVKARFIEFADFKYASGSGKILSDRVVFEKGIDTKHSQYFRYIQ
jgi:hypothetical protein